MLKIGLSFKVTSFIWEKQFMHMADEGGRRRSGHTFACPESVFPPRVCPKQDQHRTQQQPCYSYHPRDCKIRRSARVTLPIYRFSQWFASHLVSLPWPPPPPPEWPTNSQPTLNSSCRHPSRRPLTATPSHTVTMQTLITTARYSTYASPSPMKLVPWWRLLISPLCAATRLPSAKSL